MYTIRQKTKNIDDSPRRKATFFESFNFSTFEQVKKALPDFRGVTVDVYITYSSKREPFLEICPSCGGHTDEKWRVKTQEVAPCSCYPWENGRQRPAPAS